MRNLLFKTLTHHTPSCFSQASFPSSSSSSSSRFLPSLFPLNRHQTTASTLVSPSSSSSTSITPASTSTNAALASFNFNQDGKEDTILLHRMPMKPIYHGPIAKKVKRLKLFSASTLAITYTVCPLTLWLDLASNVNEAGKGMLLFLAMAISTGTTTIVNVFLKPYVSRILVDTKATHLHQYTPFALETINFFGRPKYTFTEASKIQFKSSPLSNWATPSRKFFVDTNLLETNPVGQEILNLISKQKPQQQQQH